MHEAKSALLSVLVDKHSLSGAALQDVLSQTARLEQLVMPFVAKNERGRLDVLSRSSNVAGGWCNHGL